ncbi:MAG TPA: hypothetical protein VLV86_03875 [Vicinamibacterales bacterium]|nr:hypothetical protein [Vicinamibacterales bacterium]
MSDPLGEWEADYFPLTPVHRRYLEVADRFARADEEEQCEPGDQMRNLVELMCHDRPGARRTDAKVNLRREGPDWRLRLLADLRAIGSP